MKIKTKVLSAVATGILLAVTAAAGPERSAANEVRSLRIASKFESPGSRPGAYTVTYELVNDSEKIITAWDFGCVIATQAGYPVLTRIGNDAYRTFELHRLGRDQGAPWPDRLILPGGKVRQEVPFEPAELDGPLAGKTCGPVLAIFEDTTFEGKEALADSWFESRAHQATAALETRHLLEAELAKGKDARQAVATALRLRLGRSSRPEVVDPGADRLLRWQSQITQARPQDVEELVGDLELDFQAAMAHLPARWQQEVLAEVKP